MSQRASDLTGQRFGDLVALNYLGHSRWHCQCDCGNTRDVEAYGLTSGRVQKCSVCTPPRSPGRPRLDDLVGKTYSQLTVVEYMGKRIYRSLCTCGNTRESRGWQLTSGAIKRCTSCQSDERRVTIAKVRTATHPAQQE